MRFTHGISEINVTVEVDAESRLERWHRMAVGTKPHFERPRGRQMEPGGKEK